MKKTINIDTNVISYNKNYHLLSTNDLYKNNHLIYKNLTSFFLDNQKDNICFFCSNLNEPNMIAIIDELLQNNKNVFILSWYKNKLKITKIKDDVLKNQYDFFNFNYRPNIQLECKEFNVDFLIICTKFFDLKTNSILINKKIKKFIFTKMKSTKIIGCCFDLETNQIDIKDLKQKINYNVLITQNKIIERKN